MVRQGKAVVIVVRGTRTRDHLVVTPDSDRRRRTRDLERPVFGGDEVR